MEIKQIGEYVKLTQGLAINKQSFHLVSDIKTDVFSIPLLRIADMMNNKFEKYISKDVNESVIANQDEIIYTRTGQIGLAFTGFYGVIHNNSFKVTIISKELDKDYLFALMQTDFFRNQALSKAKNSVQPDLTHEMFKSIMIPIPDIEEQKKIASIFFSLTNKIDNNNAIRDSLLNILRTTYEQWFLQFENIHNNLSFIDSKELGRKIPCGWKVQKLEELTKSLLGGTPSTKNNSYWNGDIPWLNSGEVSNFPVVESELKITKLGMDNSATKLLPVNTTVISITGNIRCSITAIETCANQSVVGVLETKLFHTSYLYQVINDLLNKYIKMSTGNCQQHINKQTIEESYVLIPPQDVLESYYDIVDPMYERLLNVGLENKTLIKLKNELLPLLINGQVTVK